jgi:hypothetical protein
MLANELQRLSSADVIALTPSFCIVSSTGPEELSFSAPKPSEGLNDQCTDACICTVSSTGAEAYFA